MSRYVSQAKRGEVYPLPITSGTKKTPLDRVPQPQHAKPRHTGWAAFCPLCCELKQHVDKVTMPVRAYMMDGRSGKQDGIL